MSDFDEYSRRELWNVDLCVRMLTQLSDCVLLLSRDDIIADDRYGWRRALLAVKRLIRGAIVVDLAEFGSIKNAYRCKLYYCSEIDIGSFAKYLGCPDTALSAK